MSHYPNIKKPERTRIARKWKNDMRKNGKFVPASRIARAKWENSVMLSIIKREKLKAYPTNGSCSCGSVNCLADGLRTIEQKSEVHVIPKRKKKSTVLPLKNCVHFSGKAT